MPKQCLYEGCAYNRWGGKYCLNHQYLRTDKKIKKERKPIKKRTPIRKGNKHSRERSRLHDKDVEFFNLIWEERPHVDFEDGRWLGNEPLLLFFHHVLPKGERLYKKYRYEKWNIVLLSWENHGKENNLQFLPKVKAYKKYLIKNLTLIDKGKLIPSQKF